MSNPTRRRAKQEAIRKKKDFKVIPGPLLPSANGQASGTGLFGNSSAGGGGGSTWGHVSVADAVASLEGGRTATVSGMMGVGGG